MVKETLVTAWRAFVGFCVVVICSYALVQWYGFRPHFLGTLPDEYRQQALPGEIPHRGGNR